MNDLEKWAYKRKILGDNDFNIDIENRILRKFGKLHNESVVELPPVDHVILMNVDIEKNRKSKIRELIIPDTVKTISAEAFTYMLNLEKVTFGKGVVYINKDAFRFCKNLKEVEFNGRVPLMNGTAFMYTPFLDELTANKDFIVDDILISPKKGTKYVDYGREIKEFAPECFSNNCDIQYAKIRSHMKYIPDSCFVGSNVKEVEIEQGVKEIHRGAFYSTDIINIDIPSSVESIHKRAFAMCSYLHTVKLNEGLEVIMPEAFFGDRSLENINIPDTVKYISNDAFHMCRMLRKVNVPLTSKIVNIPRDYVDSNREGFVYFAENEAELIENNGVILPNVKG